MEKTIGLKEKIKNSPYEIFIFAFLLGIMPPFVHMFARVLKKTFFASLAANVHTIDLLLIVVLGFIVFSKEIRKRYFSNLAPILLFSFLIIARSSQLFSGGKDAYKAAYELFKFALVSSCFFIFFSKFAVEKKKEIIKIFFIIVLSIAFFEAVIAISQYFLQRPLGLHFLGEPYFGIDLKGSALIPVEGGKRWFFDKSSDLNYLVRAHGTFVHPNILGGFLILTSMMSYYCYYISKIKWQKVLLSIFIFLQMFTIVLTYSRAAIGVCIISYLIFFSLMYLNKFKVGIASLIIVAISAIGSFALLYHQVEQRGGIVNYTEGNKDSDKDRWILQKASLQMIKEKPFMGIGYKNFILKRNDFSIKNAPAAQVHNIFLLIASETGLLGFLSFFGFLFAVAVKAYKAKLNPLSILFFSTTSGFLIIGLVDHYFITAQFGRVLFFISCGMLYFVSNKRPSYFQKASLCQE